MAKPPNAQAGPGFGFEQPLSRSPARPVQSRFLLVFKRDKLKQPLTRKDHDIIERGNVTVHSGDAVIDALLYSGPDRCNDAYIFKALYGLHPSDIQQIIVVTLRVLLQLDSVGHKPTIELLNTHVRVTSHNAKTGATEFYESFKVFIEEFKKLDPGVNYLDEGPTNAACAAYWLVSNCQIYVDSV
ncbi:hypothetical protein HOY82DRAFT_629396 [Tuber indicum]|nr:hypothetical protein HOY82DRAFT_629396 [Tuber indicum]